MTGRGTRWTAEGLELADGRRIRARIPLVAAGPATAEAIYGRPGAHSGADVRAACLTVALPTDGGPRFVLGRETPIYIAVPSRTATLAPTDGAVIQAMRYLGPGESGAAQRTLLEQTLDRLYPDWRAAAHTIRWLPEMIVMHHRPTAERGGLRGRTPVEPQPGCFVAGDWVGSRGMLADAAVASAAAAAQAIDVRLTRTRAA